MWFLVFGLFCGLVASKPRGCDFILVGKLLSFHASVRLPFLRDPSAATPPSASFYGARVGPPSPYFVCFLEKD